jgi:hypothetical protein
MTFLNTMIPWLPLSLGSCILISLDIVELIASLSPQLLPSRCHMLPIFLHVRCAFSRLVFCVYIISVRTLVAVTFFGPASVALLLYLEMAHVCRNVSPNLTLVL